MTGFRLPEFRQLDVLLISDIRDYAPYRSGGGAATAIQIPTKVDLDS